jgi:hypothetical protein
MALLAYGFKVRVIYRPSEEQVKRIVGSRIWGQNLSQRFLHILGLKARMPLGCLPVGPEEVHSNAKKADSESAEPCEHAAVTVRRSWPS